MKTKLPLYVGTPEIPDEDAYNCTYDPLVQWPKISIVTPSFNQGQYIETTIRSILLQKYPNIQYVIIDGGSKDKTLAIIKHYESYIYFWTSEPDKGQSDAINKGLKIVNGEIFNWINSDDYLLPKALKTVAELFLKNDALAIGTQSNLIRGNEFERVNESTIKRKSVLESAWERGMNQQGLFFSMESIIALKGVDDRYHYSMDLDLWVRFLLTFGQDRYFTDIFVSSVFRLHDNCKSVDGWGQGSPSDRETQALYFRLANLLKDSRYFPALNLLFPDCKTDLASLPLHSDVPTQNVEKWLNFGLFLELKKSYHLEHFERAAIISSAINPDYLDNIYSKDFKAILRYTKLHGSHLGRFVKKLLNR